MLVASRTPWSPAPHTGRLRQGKLPVNWPVLGRYDTPGAPLVHPHYTWYVQSGAQPGAGLGISGAAIDVTLTCTSLLYFLPIVRW